MNSREAILGRIRANQPDARTLPAVPAFDATLSASLETFASSIGRMGGKVVAPPPEGADLDLLIRGLFPEARVICSATPEVTGNRSIDVESPRELGDVDVGVVRARFGVAETGSVWLSDTEFKVEALGFLSQHLVVLLDPGAIVANMHNAYAHPAFRSARYAVFITGPSATADIEGILIHGAQGIRSLTVVPVRAP